MSDFDPPSWIDSPFLAIWQNFALRLRRVITKVLANFRVMLL
jgi:hypothetical protein